MSLDSWLTGASPSPMKRKLDEDKENASPSKRFKKELNQTSFDWYIKDSKGLYHCNVCRENHVATSYAKGHLTPNKTTNHQRHATCKFNHRSYLKKKNIYLTKKTICIQYCNYRYRTKNAFQSTFTKLQVY